MEMLQKEFTAYSNNLGSSHSDFPLLALVDVLGLIVSTLTFLGGVGKEVDGATDDGETDEAKGEGVPPDVPESTAGQVTEGGDDRTPVTETDQESGTNAASQVPVDF